MRTVRRWWLEKRGGVNLDSGSMNKLWECIYCFTFYTRSFIGKRIRLVL